MPRAWSVNRGCALKIIEPTVAIGNNECDRSASREPKADATKPFHMIFFNSLAAPATVSTLSPLEFSIDEVGIDPNTGGKPGDDGDASRAM